MRKAFTMITAIFVIVIMATVAMLVLNLSGKTVKETTIQYRKAQAMLLARSYTELAVLAVIDYNRTAGGDCIENIDGVVNALTPGAAPATGASSTNGGGYDVQTRIYYLGNGLNCSGTRMLNSASLSTNYNDTGGSDSIAAIIVDVYVRYKDPDVEDPAHSPWITYHRRTLQKI